MVPVQFVKEDDYAIIPSYATKGSSGFDFHSIDEVLLTPYRVQMVDTGLRCQLPNNYELQIRSRSSMGRKRIIMPHGVGTVDSDYRGRILIPLMLLSNDPEDRYYIAPGDRIAQGVVQQLPQVIIKETTVDALTQTARGKGGFGSTGVR